MSRFDEKSKIIKLDETTETPDGENRVIVEDDDSGAVNDGWPEISLTPSKTRIDSNGFDSCLVTANCRLGTGELATVAARRDKRTPDTQRTIGTTYWMTGAPRVYELIGDDTQGDEIPVKSWFERTITTTIDMERIEHVIVYQGAETVNFSADQLAEIQTAEVPVIGGVAVTVLKARAEGGGYCTVTGTFLGQEAECEVILNDPAVGAITAKADPSSIDFLTPSQIIAHVVTPAGNPVADGTLVTAVIDSGPGILTSGIATTQTETIVEEEQWSSDEITVGVANDITSLISIVTARGGYGKNYAAGATFDGKTITLAEPLKRSTTRVWVTYRAGGCAKFTFRSEEAGETDIICTAGQESCHVEVTTSALSSSSTDGSTASTESDANDGEDAGVSAAGEPTTVAGPWQTWSRSETFEPSAALPNRPVEKDYIHNGPIEFELISNVNCSIEIDPLTGYYQLYVFGLYSTGQRPYWGYDGYVKGEILLEKKDAEGTVSPVRGWNGQITWSAWGSLPEETEGVADANADAIAAYQYGRPGTHSIEITLAPKCRVPQTKEFPLPEEDISDGGSDTSYRDYKSTPWSVLVRWRPISG